MFTAGTVFLDKNVRYHKTCKTVFSVNKTAVTLFLKDYC